MGDQARLNLLQADVAAFVETLAPNEALCLARRLCSGMNDGLGRLIQGFDSPQVDVVAAVVAALTTQAYFLAVDALVQRCVGSTEDHPDGACSCLDNGPFFDRIGRRYVSAMLDLPEDGA